ncbi:MAG TPA: LysR family transcriptional regulator [Stellaceae bacterium]|nr:LysR family transcriptional regulator [Stellaceae bacterium]
MELRQLDHFVAVAEEQNFTRAARRVHIVQSALSTSIRALEEELGTRLFRRGARHATLTLAGEMMLERARRVLKEVRDTRDAIAGVHGLVAGTLTVCIGLVQSIEPLIDVIGLLARFHRQHPSVHIRVYQRPTERAYDDLRSERADIIFAGLPDSLPAGVEAFGLSRDRLVFVCARTNPLAKRKSLRAAELQNEPFADLTREWYARRRVDQYCRSVKLRRRVTCEVNELTTLFDLVASGMGVAITDSRLPAQYHEELAIVDLVPAALSLDYGAVIPIDRGSKTRRLSAAARAFLATIENPPGGQDGAKTRGPRAAGQTGTKKRRSSASAPPPAQAK